MISEWFLYDFRMVSASFLYVSGWFSYGFCMASVWFPYSFCMVFAWFCMVAVWFFTVSHGLGRDTKHHIRFAIYMSLVFHLKCMCPLQFRVHVSLADCFCIVFAWFLLCFCMASLWLLHGCCMVFAWFLHGFWMVSACFCIVSASMLYGV
jgi:hypothetical protein